jgi:iron(III) transport system permease protein
MDTVGAGLAPVERPPSRANRVLGRLGGNGQAVERLLFVGALLIVGYLVVAPLVFLLYNTFVGQDGLTLDAIGAAMSADGAGDMLVNSLVFAAGSAIVAMVPGTALAYLTVRTNAPLKPVLFAISLVPLIIPGILFTVAWVYLLSGRIGVINKALEAIGLGILRFDVFSMPGMILVEGLHMSPIVFLLMAAAFRSLDPSLEESALMSGAGLGGVIRRITLPLVRPALLAGLLIMVVRALEGFETPAILGIPDGTYVLTSRIFLALSTFPVRYDLAGAYSIGLVLITLIMLSLYRWFNRQSERYQVITGKGYRPHSLELGRWRWPIGGLFLVYFVLVVVAPLAILVYMSLLPFYTPPSVEALQRMSLDNYRRMVELRDVAGALQNSFLLAVGSATLVMVLMSVVAWVVVRSRVRFRYGLDALSMTPLSFPGVVLGVALIFLYLRFPLEIYATLWILLIAYITQFLPYGMRYASASMFQVGRELEESAAMSGASWWQTFQRIVLPLIFPGLLAGWIYVMIVSVRQLSSSILLYAPGTEVFSVLMWQLYTDGYTTVLAAVGVSTVGVLILLAAIAHRIGGRVGVRVA